MFYSNELLNRSVLLFNLEASSNFIDADIFNDSDSLLVSIEFIVLDTFSDRLFNSTSFVILDENND